MGPLANGAGPRLAVASALLAAAVAACASPAPGATAPGAAGRATALGPGPTPSPVAPGTPVTGTPPTEPTGPVPVVTGCPSGTVAITHYPGDPGLSTACVTAGSRLRLTLPSGGPQTWGPPRVTPAGAATVAATTDSAGTMRALVTPAGTAPFCLTAILTPVSPTAAVAIWRLCVTIRR